MSETMHNALGALGQLSARERVLVALLGAVMAALLTFGAVWLVGSRLDKAERRLDERKEQLALIEGLQGKYRVAEQHQREQSKKLESNAVSLFSLLQKTAGELGLTLDNLNERKSPIKEANVDEISVDVSLPKVSITKLNKFLEKMEGYPNTGLVKVTKLKVKTNFTNEDLLDVHMTVATYRVHGKAAAGEAAPAAVPNEAPGGEP